MRNGHSILCVNIGFWKEIPLSKLFEQRFGVPCTLESSTRAQVLAERVLGVGECSEIMIYVVGGKGIGADIF
jgi:glucokinase